MRTAWILLFLAPFLFFLRWYLGVQAGVEMAKSGANATVYYAMLCSGACLVGGIGCVAGFLLLAAVFGKQEPPS